MGLPTIKPTTRRLTLSGGQKLQVRGLNRTEALRMADHGEDIGALETDLLAASTDTPLDEAQEWYAGAPSTDVQLIVNTVLALSGLDGELGKGSSAA